MFAATRTFATRRAWSEVYVGRQYFRHGFVDIAMRLFLRNAAHVRREDWKRLVGALMTQGRVIDAIAICERGRLPLPRPQLLALGDRCLRLKDVDGAKHWFDVAGADSERWARLLDVLTAMPGRQVQAVAVAQRYLGSAAEPAVRDLAAAV